MAFVTPASTASSFTSGRPLSSVCKSTVSRPVVQNETRSSSAQLPRMAFSSIDDPSTAITADDECIETGDLVIYNMYKQIFGNSYIMDSERDELAVAESDYKLNKINVKELARAFAKSDLYKQRFFERCGPYAFVELNFKHFLGRAPYSQQEISAHVQTLNNEGYEKEIDSYFDSGEYDSTFGVTGVPRFIFKGAYPSNDDFNKMCYLRRYWDGCSTSTKTGSTYPTTAIKAQFIMPPNGHIGNPVQIEKGIKADHNNKPLPSVPSGFNIPKNAYAGIRVRLEAAPNSYIVFETDSYVSKDLVPSWKKEKAEEDASKKFNGVWY